MKDRFCALSIIVAFCCTVSVSHAQDRKGLEGHWKLIPEKSASIDPWSHLDLDIATSGSRVTIVKRYDAGNALDRRTDSVTVNTGGKEEAVAVPAGRWLGQVSMGIYYGPRTTRYVLVRMSDSRGELSLDARETLQTAQGSIEVRVAEKFALSPDGSTLLLSETRSTRTSGPPLTYTFARVPL